MNAAVSILRYRITSGIPCCKAVSDHSPHDEYRHAAVNARRNAAAALLSGDGGGGGERGEPVAALEQAGLVHPRAEAVTAALFSSAGFFLPADKVQVKYEMLRAHLVEHVPVTAAAAAHAFGLPRRSKTAST